MARLKTGVVELGCLVLWVLSSCAGSNTSPTLPAAGQAGDGRGATALITANHVDVTGDDGALLADRLNIGDVVFIVNQPRGGSRPGWIRVSRTAQDTLGFGWVEAKHVRAVSGYKTSGSSGTLPPVMEQDLPAASALQSPSLPAFNPSPEPSADPLPPASQDTAPSGLWDGFEDADDIFSD